MYGSVCSDGRSHRRGTHSIVAATPHVMPVEHCTYYLTLSTQGGNEEHVVEDLHGYHLLGLVHWIGVKPLSG
jgi:hypothetical protein